MFMKRLLTVFALLLVLMMSSLASAQEAPSGTLTLYTSESEDDVNAVVAAFNEAYPDVEIEVFRSGSGEVVARLQAEMEAGEIQADVIWFADADFFSMLADEDLLLAYEPQLALEDEALEAAEEALAQYHYNDNRYHEVRLIFNVVAYNTALVEEAPTSWNDLIDPQYNGLVGMPSALYSGAAFNQVGTFVNDEAFGWEYYEALRDNGVVVNRGNGAVLNGLATGEQSIVQVVDFFVRAAKADGSPVEHIWPEEGALLVPTPIGILADTDNAAAAQALIDFLYTEPAQVLFTELGYIPVLPGVDMPEGTPDMEAMTIIMPDLEYISENREAIRERFTELFGTIDE
jgi:iron(III) transport system substrate-binding protein